MAVQEALEVDGVTPAPQFCKKNIVFWMFPPDVSALIFFHSEKLGHAEKLTEL